MCFFNQNTGKSRSSWFYIFFHLKMIDFTLSKFLPFTLPRLSFCCYIILFILSEENVCYNSFILQMDHKYLYPIIWTRLLHNLNCPSFISQPSRLLFKIDDWFLLLQIFLIYEYLFYTCFVCQFDYFLKYLKVKVPLIKVHLFFNNSDYIFMDLLHILVYFKSFYYALLHIT